MAADIVLEISLGTCHQRSEVFELWPLVMNLRCWHIV